MEVVIYQVDSSLSEPPGEACTLRGPQHGANTFYIYIRKWKPVVICFIVVIETDPKIYLVYLFLKQLQSKNISSLYKKIVKSESPL